MDEQGRKWYETRNMKVPDPTKYTTPYGGRLVWTLPGGTQVICHLKVRCWPYPITKLNTK